MTTSYPDKPFLILDSAHGIFIPQLFTRDLASEWFGPDPENLAICAAGPDHEHYWEAWDSVA